MSLDSLVSVSISANTRTPSQTGFGTPLIAAYHTCWPDRVREYTSLDDMVTDGFSTNPLNVSYPAYLAAQRAFAQNPRPASIKIGRRASAPSQVIKLTPTANAAGTKYYANVPGKGDLAYTVPAGRTLAQVVTAIQGLLVTLLGAAATVTEDGTDITITTATAGVLLNVKARNPELRLANTTADPGLAADLAAILAADDNWYGLGLDSNSKAEILVAAAWTEAQTAKFGAFDTADTACGDSNVATDVISTLKASSYTKCVCFYNGSALLSFMGISIMCEELPFPPGSRSWAYKTVRGVEIDNPTVTQQSQILAEKGNVYVPVKGIGITLEGFTPSGEFADVAIGVDWLKARLQERIFGVLLNNGKVPFTASGIALIENEVRAQLQQGVDAQLLAADSKDTPIVVTVPKLSQISAADKGTRTLRNVTFSATLAGAIHHLVIQGTLSL